MTAVKQLTPTALHEFQRQFAEWRQQSDALNEEETALVQACKAGLSADDEGQLRKLIAKSERGTLRPKELQDYRSLVQKAQRLDATRVAALTQLARLWGKPVRVVMEAIGWDVEEKEDGTSGHPARPAKAGARSRR